MHNLTIDMVKRLAVVTLAGSVLFMSGCSDSDSDSSHAPSMLEYTVSVTNLTSGQPLSPAAILVHDEMWKSFQTGTASSEAIEHLAEAGDNSVLLAEIESDADVYDSASGQGIILPGESESFELEVNSNYQGTLSLSVLSMLVNTNDALAALNGESIGELGINESMTFELLTYDAGTEANTESEDSVPGPAAEGGLREGFNANRDDVRNAVYVHSGVVTQGDGLSTSTLAEVHRWDHPAVRVHVERIN